MTVLESGFNRTLVNTANKNGTIDYGLMQVNSASVYLSGMQAADIMNLEFNVKTGTLIFFDKFDMVDYDTTKLWEAVGCFNGCSWNETTSQYDPNVPAYVEVIRSIYNGMWR